MTHPAAYLRRSYVDADSPGDISLETQRAAIRRLADTSAADGELVEYNDWGISADVAKAAQRTAYTRLLADMEAGRVSALYAFDVDRLYRDPRDLIRLQDAAQRHQVRIVTTGGSLAIGDGDDPSAEAFAFIGSVFGRLELQKAKKRARAAREARMARGDQFGHAPIGWRHVRDASGRIVREPDPGRPLQTILDAYREAGTVLGAVKLLNERGVGAPRGGKWYTSALTRTIEQNWPEQLPAKGASRKRIKASAILSQIVRCHCGHVMTPNTVRRQIYCSMGTVTPGHGRYVVAESKLLPWMREEAARLAVPHDTLEPADRTEGRRQALRDRRERIIVNFEDGLIDRAGRDVKLAAVDAQMQQLAAAEHLASIPAAIEWDSWTPAAINGVLRALWEYVQLDENMRPVSAEWLVPEWRAP